MSEHSRRKKARDVLTRSGYSAGGHLGRKSDEGEGKHEIEESVKKGIAQHEAHDHKGEKRTRIHLRDGGVADGYASGGRPDKKPRGKKGKTEVNVMVAGQQPPQKVPVPVPVPAPHPPMAGPGGPPPGMPPGAPPPGMGAMPPGMPQKPPGMLKAGGRAGPKFEGGAGGGMGRLEKAEHEKHREGGHR